MRIPVNTGIALAFILASFLTTASAQPNEVNPNGFNVFYYENGNVSSEGYLKNGKPDGYWKTFYETGIIKSEGNRLEYQLDSIWKFYDVQGKLILEMTYKEGKKNGFRRTWSPEGMIEEWFEQDMKQGFENTYDTLNRLIKKTTIVNGLPHGITYEYDTLGVLISIIEYKTGFPVLIEKINRIDQDGKKQGNWKVFFADGRIDEECSYVNGKSMVFIKNMMKKEIWR
jgi:uncharacterized protein